MNFYFALVGCGRIGKVHAEQISTIGKLIAVCDIDKEKAIEFAEKYNATAYYTLTELLAHEKELDIITICTPNGLHAQQSIDCLKAGKHVLCEKPMALKVEDCKAMIEASEKANKKLFIVKQNRFNPPVVALKKAIDEGRLGKIVNVQLNCFWNRNADYYSNSTWKGTKELDGGTLFTQFSHFIDLLYWTIGDIEDIEVYTSNALHQNMIEFEDTGVVILKFENGALGTVNYTVNAHQKNMEGSLTVFGEKGTIKVGGQYLNELEYQNIENYSIETIEESSKANQYENYQGSMSNHDKVYQNLKKVFTTHSKFVSSLNDSLKTVEIIEKIYSKTRKENE